MANFKKTNGKYFELIPKTPELVETIYQKVQDKQNKKEQRLKLVIKAQKIRKEIYNLSMEINKHEEAIDQYILRHFKNK